ncbi:hypothetical protein, partial [Limnospira platensis]|uniref:hypothetical protein n=1 Tax=Limnospira platensis TaxID=118562 RepID=UPI001A7EC3F8
AVSVNVIETDFLFSPYSVLRVFHYSSAIGKKPDVESGEAGRFMRSPWGWSGDRKSTPYI